MGRCAQAGREGRLHRHAGRSCGPPRTGMERGTSTGTLGALAGRRAQAGRERCLHRHAGRSRPVDGESWCGGGSCQCAALARYGFPARPATLSEQPLWCGACAPALGFSQSYVGPLLCIFPSRLPRQVSMSCFSMCMFTNSLASSLSRAPAAAAAAPSPQARDRAGHPAFIFMSPLAAPASLLFRLVLPFCRKNYYIYVIIIKFKKECRFFY